MNAHIYILWARISPKHFPRHILGNTATEIIINNKAQGTAGRWGGSQNLGVGQNGVTECKSHPHLPKPPSLFYSTLSPSNPQLAQHASQSPRTWQLEVWWFQSCFHGTGNQETWRTITLGPIAT